MRPSILQVCTKITLLQTGYKLIVLIYYKEEAKLSILKVFVVTGLTLLLLINSTGVVLAQDEESFVRRSMVSKKDAIVLSVIYPGLGQMTAGQKYKGISLFLAETVSLLFTINAHENYRTKQKVYDKDMIEFNNIAKQQSGEYGDAFDMYNDLKDRNDELDNLNTVRNVALIAAVAVYAYNIVDAVFFSSSTGESSRADNSKSKVVLRSTIIDRNPGILLSKSF